MTVADMPTAQGCTVCGGSIAGKKRAKEDVVPKWLQRHLEIRDAPADPQVIGPPGSSRTSGDEDFIIKQQRRHSFRSGLAGEVCKECNGGWMSRLETEVQPILKKLIADPLASDFKRREWETLARWLLKTSYMFERSSNWDHVVFIPHEHIRLVRDGQLPRGVAFFISPTEVIHPHCFQWVTQDWIGHVFETEPTARESFSVFSLRTYKATMHLRGLIMTMAYVPPEPGWRIARWLEMHRHVLSTGIKVDGIPGSLPRDQIERVIPAIALPLSRWRKYPAEVVGRTETGKPIYDHEVEVAKFCKRLSATTQNP